MATAEELTWVEVQATAFIVVHGAPIARDEVREVNVSDPETAGLVRAGLLVIVDEETRKLLPPPKSTSTLDGGCGCG